MIKTMKLQKSVALGVLVAMFVAMFFMLATPFVANAADCVANATPAPGAVIDGTKSGNVPSACITAGGELVISGGNFNAQQNAGGVWTTVLEKYRGFIVGVSGIGAITMVVLFIMQFLKLGASAGNPQARSQALSGVLWTGIAAAGLGSVSLVVGLFYHGLT
jgi:hypothetical protein